MQIIITTGFNNGNRPKYGLEKGIKRPLSEEWIAERYKIWKKYSLKSMMAQTYRNWMWVIKLHWKTRHITKGMFSKHDDRIIESYSDKNQYRIISDFNEVLLIRLDSDDMYRKNAVEKYHKIAIKKQKEFYLCKTGYIYDQKNNVLAKYDPKHSSPFHARLVIGKEHGMLRIGMQHRRIAEEDPHIIPGNMFIVGINGSNTSSRMQLATGDVPERDWRRILRKFGI